MDEMKLNLTSSFMRKMVAKLLSKMLFKKFGCKVYIDLTELRVDYSKGRASIHINGDAEMNGDEFKKLVKDFKEE